MGTAWITQRGLNETDMVEVANIIADVLHACTPYSVITRQGQALRVKVDFMVLETAKLRVRALTEKAGIDYTPTRHDYPHFSYIDDQTPGKQGCLQLSSARARSFARYVFSSDVEGLAPGQSQNTCLFTPQGIIEGILTCVNLDTYQFSLSSEKASLAAAWLRALSDGYVGFDPDVTRRIPGPVVVQALAGAPLPTIEGDAVETEKSYFIGMNDFPASGEALPAFVWEEKEPSNLQRTSLYETYRKLGARMVPFAGWEMPVQYTSIVEEHLATRQAAGLFDVSHMGVFQAEGQDAVAFLDSVCGNDISALEVGESSLHAFP